MVDVQPVDSGVDGHEEGSNLNVPADTTDLVDTSPDTEEIAFVAPENLDKILNDLVTLEASLRKEAGVCRRELAQPETADVKILQADLLLDVRRILVDLTE